jgi:epoxyqueuosine reductase
MPSSGAFSREDVPTSEGFTGVRDGINCTKPPYSAVIETRELREIATRAGAVGFGVTSAKPFLEARQRLWDGRTEGLSGSLHFTYEDPDTATDVKTSFDWARSLVVFSHNYPSLAPPESGAVVARFARENHYLAVERIAATVSSALTDAGHRSATLIDDNRLVDRSAATRAGITWLGKSTMALSPLHGPWLLLGTVVTDARLTSTPPMIRSCGACVACVPACPTDAITPAGLDARRCIAAWLQSPGSLPRWIRPHIGRRIYGCDDCLTACPPGNKTLTAETVDEESLPFSDLLEQTDSELVERFHWWYVPRRDGRYLRRNLLVAAGNSREEAAIPTIRNHLSHKSSMIRGHAAWALARAAGVTSRPELLEALELETVAEPIDEIEHALTMIESRES